MNSDLNNHFECQCSCVCLEHLMRKLGWIEATQPDAPEPFNNGTLYMHILRLRWGWPLADAQAPDSS